VSADRPALIPVLRTHILVEAAAIAQALPNERIALQCDMCQEVIAWERLLRAGVGRFPPGDAAN
jgi:hypothetical protein